jgi:hypothetical protein
MEEIERIFEMLNLQKIILFWAIYFHNIKIIGHLNVS